MQNRGAKPPQGGGCRILPWSVLILAILLGVLIEREHHLSEKHQQQLIQINELNMTLLRAEMDLLKGAIAELTTKLKVMDTDLTDCCRNKHAYSKQKV